MEDCGRSGGGTAAGGRRRGVVFLRGEEEDDDDDDDDDDCRMAIHPEDDACMRGVLGGGRRSRAESDSSFCRRRRLHSFPARARCRPTSCPPTPPNLPCPVLPARTPIYESVIRERYALAVPRPLALPLTSFCTRAVYLPCMHAHLHTSSRCAVQCACLPIIRCLHPSPCRGLPRSLARFLI